MGDSFKMEKTGEQWLSHVMKSRITNNGTTSCVSWCDTLKRTQQHWVLTFILITRKQTKLRDILKHNWPELKCQSLKAKTKQNKRKGQRNHSRLKETQKTWQLYALGDPGWQVCHPPLGHLHTHWIRTCIFTSSCVTHLHGQVWEAQNVPSAFINLPVKLYSFNEL